MSEPAGRSFSARENHLEAEAARRRPTTMGIVSPTLPPRPIYTNDAEREAQRRAEYNQLSALFAAEAAAWNAEARRWRTDRVATVATDAFPFSTRSSSRDIQFRAPSCSMEAAAEQEQKQQQKEHRFRLLHL